MKVTPQISADFDEYPELRRLYDASLRRIVELMEIHDIIELRRIRKSGVFDHPYTKDIVTPMGLPYVPSTVSAARYAVGEALLNYLEAIGVRGLTLDVTQEDADNISAMWAPQSESPEAPATDAGKDAALTPSPVEPETTPESPAKTAEKTVEKPVEKQTQKSANTVSKKESEKQKHGKAKD